MINVNAGSLMRGIAMPDNERFASLVRLIYSDHILHPGKFHISLDDVRFILDQLSFTKDDMIGFIEETVDGSNE